MCMKSKCCYQVVDFSGQAVPVCHVSSLQVVPGEVDHCVQGQVPEVDVGEDLAAGGTRTVWLDSVPKIVLTDLQGQDLKANIEKTWVGTSPRGD